MRRRTFLLGAVGAAASCSRLREGDTLLGKLAYVDGENLWIRDLPDGVPKRVSTGHRIAWPRFSPSGRWISFQDGSLGRLVPAGAGLAAGRQWNIGEVGSSPLNCAESTRLESAITRFRDS